MTDKVTDAFLECIINGDEPVWSEAHDMAVELILRRRDELGSGQPCATCGKNRHTPLRRDDMGGYVCLQCVDERLTKLASMAKRIAEAMHGR